MANKEEYGKIVRIEEITPTYYLLLVVNTSGRNPNLNFHQLVVGTKNESKNILDKDWRGKRRLSIYTKYELKPATEALLPKFPHYLASFFGGYTTLETDYNYDKDGKATATGYRCLQVINRHDKNPLVEKCTTEKWPDSPTFTIIEK